MALGYEDHQLSGLEAASAETGIIVALGENKELRCTQCKTTKTPQWRTGPQGPRTMCNACGVKWQRAERKAQAPVNEDPVIPASSRGPRRQACRAAAKRHRFVSVYYSGSEEEEMEYDNRKRRLLGQAGGQLSMKHMRSHEQDSGRWAGTQPSCGEAAVDADEEAAALDLLALAGSSDGSPVREVSAQEAADGAVSMSHSQLPFLAPPAAPPMASAPQIIQPSKTSGPSALKASAVQALVTQLEGRGAAPGGEVSEGGDTCATVGPLMLGQDAAATASLAAQRSSYTSGSSQVVPAGQASWRRLRTQPVNVYNSTTHTHDPDSDSGEVADHHASRPQVVPVMTTTSARPAQRRRTCAPGPPPLLPASSSYLARNAGSTVAAMMQAAQQQQQQMLPPLSRHDSLEECCSGPHARRRGAVAAKHEATGASQPQLMDIQIKPEPAAEQSAAGVAGRGPALSAPTRAPSLTLTPAGALPPIQLPPVSLSATTWQPAPGDVRRASQGPDVGTAAGKSHHHHDAAPPAGPQEGSSPRSKPGDQPTSSPPGVSQVSHFMRLSGAVMAAMQGLQQAEAARTATAALVSSRAAVASVATQAALAKTAALAAELQALETMLALQAGASAVGAVAGMPNAGIAATVLAASVAAQEAVLAANLAYSQSLSQRAAAAGAMPPVGPGAPLPPAAAQEAGPLPAGVAH